MKKIISLIGVAVFVFLPFTVRALIVNTPLSCTSDGEGNKTCTVSVNFEGTETDSVTAKLTEAGGAEIDGTSITGVNWEVDSKTAITNGYNVVLKSDIGESGEATLFKFTYKVSGTTDCAVTLEINGKTATDTTDVPTENKKTGSTIPFVALGTMALLAGGAYVLTKNKSKMYNI